MKRRSERAVCIECTPMQEVRCWGASCAGAIVSVFLFVRGFGAPTVARVLYASLLGLRACRSSYMPLLRMACRCEAGGETQRSGPVIDGRSWCVPVSEKKTHHPV